jgi:uncharacterized protein
MSCREEQDFAGLVIDSLKFAANGDCVTGRLSLAAMPRLADALVDTAGSLDCRIGSFRGEGGLDGKMGLILQVSGRLWLHCQRCLGKVAFDCVIDSRLLLVPEGVVWSEDELESEDYDAIPAEHELDVMALVEDEVLLALPLVPRHEDCQAPATGVQEAEERAASPFAVLAGLKKY